MAYKDDRTLFKLHIAERKSRLNDGSVQNCLFVWVHEEFNLLNLCGL